MDKSNRELLALLSVRIASIMEDEVFDAIASLPHTHSAGAAHFEKLETAGHDIASLSAAANVVLRRSGSKNC